jgi:6-phosphofructokinase 2
LEEGVYMIKPNLHEIGLLYHKEVSGEDALILARGIINKNQSEIVVVSQGAAGALLVTQKDNVHYAAPAAKKVSTVGAGDSMVAGIVHQLSMGWPVKEAVRYGVACGTAATMNNGARLCTRADVEMLYSAMQKLPNSFHYQGCKL